MRGENCMEYILEMKDISKTFPGVKALDHVQLQVRPGEVHALMGENGAGKSTLMKILMGIYTRDAGCDDSCFHSFMFSFVSSGSRSPAPAGSAASAPEEIPGALRWPRTLRGILRIGCRSQSPPKRRERRLNSMMAASRSSRVKSGHRTSISTSSE